MTVLTGLARREIVVSGWPRATPQGDGSYVLLDALAQDDGERWITVNGGEGDGQAVMIEKNGSGSGWVIKGGAGGALNGTVVHPKSMSKPAGGSPTPSPAPTPAVDPRIAEAHRLSDVANNGEKRTHHETWVAHINAAKAHQELADEFSTARFTAKGNGDEDAAREAHRQYHVHNDKYYEHAIAATKARDKYFSAEKRAAKKELVARISETDDGKTVAAIEKRFDTGSAEEIAQHLKERFGLGLHNGSNAHREYKAAKAEWRKNYGKWTPEERDAARDRLNALHSAARGTHSAVVRSHTEYDIDDGSAGAKAARKAMGHVHAALEHLESQGFDIKAALSSANVQYAPGNVGKSLGHAYQRGGVGYFTMSAGKSDLAYRQKQIDSAKRREEAGKPRWTISSGSGIAGSQRATAIHEMAHALGMQPHINSPDKLQRQLQADFPNYADRRAWIVKNISEYAASNIHETDAELATLVTSPDYVRGTLPKAYEDHVDALFHRKKDA